MADLRLGPTATGAGYERLRTALERAEASNDPGAIQRHTKAVGFYQFIPRWWNKWVKKNTGRELSSFLPKDDSPAERARAAKEQREVLFPAYYEKEMAPWMADMRKKGLGKGLSDIQLASTFHKLGSKHGTAYLKTGWDSSAGTVDNSPIADYNAQVDRYASDNRLTPNTVGPPLPRHDDVRGPPRPATRTEREPPKLVVQAAAGQQRAPIALLPDAAANDNARILAELNILQQRLGLSVAQDAALDRVRAEGRGA